MGSPPPAGSKNLVLKFRSVSNIVIPPAKTGRERINSSTVIITDHTKSGRRSKVIPGLRILMAVEMKLTAPRIEAIPARWREKIAKSTLPPA